MKKALMAAAACSLFLVHADTLTWQGGAGDDRWSVAGNWSSSGTHACPQDDDDVVLSPSRGETEIVNDIANLSVGSLTVTCGSLSLKGQALEITGGMAVSCSELQLSMPLVWNASGSFSHASGHVWFLGGFTLSGSSDFVKTGAGFLHLACDNSAFEGKIKIGEGSCESYTASGLGAAGFEFDACGQLYSLYLDFAGTVNAPCVFKNGNSGSFVFRQNCDIVFAKSVTCVGSVRLNSNGKVRFSGGLSEDAAGASDVILNGTIFVDGEDDAGDFANQLAYCDWGDIHLGARIAGCRGFDVGKGGLTCERTNVFHATENFVRIGFGYSEPDYVDYFDLNGHDQAIQCLLYRAPENVVVTREVRTADPAALTIAGCGDTFDGHLNGALTLVMDPVWGGTFNLQGGLSTMSGGLVCRRGGISVAADVSMPNLSLIQVEGGTITLHAAVGSDTLEVALSGDGALSLGEGVVITAFRARRDGNWLAAGVYTAGDVTGLQGDGTLVVLDDGPVTHEGTAVWTGAAGDAVSAPANWRDGIAPDLSRGTWAMSFSEGTATARLAEPAKTWGLLFSAVSGFTLGGPADAVLTLGTGGITTANPNAEGTVGYEVGVPVSIRKQAEDMTFAVADRTTLTLSGAFSSEESKPLVRASGGGAVVFSGENAAWRTSYEQRGGTLRFCGEHAAGAADAERSVTFVGPCGQPTGDFLKFSGTVSNAVPLRLAGAVNNLADTDDETMFTQYGEVECLAHPDNADEFVTFRHTTPFTYCGGITSTNSPAHVYLLIPGASRHVYVKDKPVVTSKNVYQDSDGWLHLDVTGNRANALVTYNAHTACGAPDALFGYCLLGPAVWAGASLIDLGGFDQHVMVIEGSTLNAAAEHEVTSASPAMVTFTLGYSLQNNLKFTGAAGLHYAAVAASATMTLNFASTTKGTLRVSSGVLAIAPGAGWTSVSNVVLESTGTLKVLEGAAETAFGPRAGASDATFIRNGGGTLEIPAGETATVRTLAIPAGGTELDYQPVGVYAGVGGGADASHTLDWLVGGGKLRVLRQPGSGLMVIVR